MRTVRDFLNYDPREAVQFVRELPEDEAKRILDLLTDEEYTLYQTGKAE
jgi:Mg/Co/Ni transporter MgtE